MIIAIRTNNSETREETEFLKKKMLTDYMDEIEGKSFSFTTKTNKSGYGIDVILEVNEKRGHGMSIEEAKELLAEEYERAKRLEYVHNPLAYALHQVILVNEGYRKTSEVAEYAIKKVVGLIKDYAYFPIETPKGMIEQKVVDIDDIERSADGVISVLKKIYKGERNEVQ